jgi:hypothetical protein|tara:strand:+ start:3656 stop:4483 length:828 start_codon:yes stop_codon:yes gene_type:complete
MTHYDEAKTLKAQDMRLALRIAGIAGISTRDRHGNIVSDVWTQYNLNETENLQLLDIASVRSLLTEQLKLHLEAKRDMLLDLDDPGIVAQWIMNFSQSWEKKYQERVNQNWDMSQRILTAMEETLIEVREIFDNLYCGLDYNYMMGKIKEIYKTTASDTDSNDSYEDDSLYTDQRDALIRVIFRSKHIGPMLVNLAGKILQKQLVCNKAGMYSARIQRNDVTREKDHAVEALVSAHFDNSPLFQYCKEHEFEDLHELRRLCMDHTKIKQISMDVQ